MSVGDWHGTLALATAVLLAAHFAAVVYAIRAAAPRRARGSRAPLLLRGIRCEARAHRGSLY